ncbi:hypothetical protein EDM22_01335 [Agromyces tardus]|uniref:Uncharacterized protein n=1 Tax=Agromyces tardus TaxID=2583849 RepID=A0A3M8AMF1_9MICO|nr:hypothetical protein EDM22_01335 [Agromyces tardus]
MEFSWPEGGRTFSFDLGGLFKYDEFDGQTFYAESKMYSDSSNLPGHYEEFLAKCYVAYLDRAMFCDHFMWISWSPHTASRWSTHTSEETVRAAVIAQRKRIFGDLDEATAEGLVDDAVVSEVASRLWLIILSERQEQLVITPGHRGLIEAYEAEKASS